MADLGEKKAARDSLSASLTLLKSLPRREERRANELAVEQARVAVERAKAIQPYDIGPGGRFWEQRLALGVILEHPNGLGPFEFFRVYGTQQHDVYMQAFLVYGWIGGVAGATQIAG